MNELSIGVGVHCDEHTKVISEHSKATVNCAAYRMLKLQNTGYAHVNIFLTAQAATAIHAELEQLYPELATASEPPTEVVMHYADSHAHEVAPTEDDAIAAMVAELADSPNARKFGSKSSLKFSYADLARCGTVEEIQRVVDDLKAQIATNPALPCDGRRCCFVGRACEQTDNGRFSCTLPPGHTGPHSACGSDNSNSMSGHNLHVWANENATTNAT